MALNMLNLVPNTVSVRELQRNYREVIKKAKQSQDAIVLLNNSKPEAVILDTQTYNDLMADNYTINESKILRLVNQARRSYKAGKAKRLASWNDLDS